MNICRNLERNFQKVSKELKIKFIQKIIQIFVSLIIDIKEINHQHDFIIFYI